MAKRGEFKREPIREMSDKQVRESALTRFGEDGWEYFKKEWRRVTESLKKYTRGK